MIPWIRSWVGLPNPGTQGVLVPTVEIQRGSSSFSGRTVVQLPNDDNYRKEWESLGVQWLEPFNEGSVFSSAVLPEGWTIETEPSNIRCRSIQRVVDDKCKKRVEIWIQLAPDPKGAIVFFCDLEVTKNDFRPVCYPGYSSQLYCSYEEIIDAIKSWGEVEAILMSQGGLYHTFIVSFKEPIQFLSYEEKGSAVELSANHTICGTPFKLQGMYKGGSNCSDHVILSRNRMVFSINYLQAGTFNAWALWGTQSRFFDKRLSEIQAVAATKNWDSQKKRIDSVFNESDKAKKLLEWIKLSGLLILKEGLCGLENSSINEYPVNEIIENYLALNSDYPWQVVMRSENDFVVVAKEVFGL